MNEMMPVVEYRGKQVVNARDLHMRLEVGRDFSNWIKDRIEKYGFAEGADYIIWKPYMAEKEAEVSAILKFTGLSGIVPNIGDSKEPSNFDSPNLANQKKRGGDRRSIDYFLYLQMAKEIAMVENNEKGREIRRYLIKVEEAWNTPEAVMARAQQMGALPKWKSPPAARIKEIRLAYDKGSVTVNEYRREAFNLPPFEIDAPLERPGKGAKPDSPPDGLLKFADQNLEFTGNPNDFVRLDDVYERYVQQSEKPLSRWTFIHTLKGAYSLISRQKKLNGYPVLVFIGCRFKANHL